MSILNDKEIPVGLGMALAQNLDLKSKSFPERT